MRTIGSAGRDGAGRTEEGCGQHPPMVSLVSLHAFPWQHWLAKWKVSLADTWTVKVSAMLQLSAEQALSSYNVMFSPTQRQTQTVSPGYSVQGGQRSWRATALGKGRKHTLSSMQFGGHWRGFPAKRKILLREVVPLFSKRLSEKQLKFQVKGWWGA